MEETKIRVLGGMSFVNRISILSDQFLVTARCSPETGKIMYRIKRHSAFLRFFYQHKRLPIPRLLKLILFFVGIMTKKGWINLFFYALIFALVGNCESLKSEHNQPSLYWWIAYAGFITLAFTFVRLRIASWHGAEHMAIAAYDRTGSTEIEAIARECPIHDKCGGRLMFPFTVGPIAVGLATASLGLNEWLVTLVTIELILWVDVLIGWDKIPVASHASHIFQRYITTRKPGQLELLTAQRALRELEAAHRAL